MKKLFSWLILAMFLVSLAAPAFATDLQFVNGSSITVNQNLGIATKMLIRGAIASRSGQYLITDVSALRTRTTIANVNTGVTLFPALPNRKYRIYNFKIIAVGGAVTSTTATGIKVTCTQAATPVTIFVIAKAGLTQSTILRDGDAAVVVLADGASLNQCDTNTAITMAANGGSDLAGATNIDTIIDYSVE